MPTDETQPKKYTCTFHALSHITGRTLEELEATLPPISSTDRRINPAQTWRYLESLGYALLFAVDPCYRVCWPVHPYFCWRVHTYAQNVPDARLLPSSEWPPTPFAPFHFCVVREKGFDVNHAVVLHSDGTVYDHLQKSRLTLSAYEAVLYVVGLHPKNSPGTESRGA